MEMVKVSFMCVFGTNRSLKIMRLILVGILIICMRVNFVFSQQPIDTILDSRDGKTYKTVKIGEQWWMAENLNLGIMVNGMPVGINQKDNNQVEKYCYGDAEGNCAIYGGLYDWFEAMNYTSIEKGFEGTEIQGICPCGWHLPSDTD